jgi:hypothetical protein
MASKIARPVRQFDSPGHLGTHALSQAISAGVSACLLRDMSIDVLSRSLELVMLGL